MKRNRETSTEFDNNSQYVMVIKGSESPTINVPNGMMDYQEDSLSIFEIIGELYIHKAIIVSPKASQIPAVRDFVRGTSIDMMVFVHDDDPLNVPFSIEIGGLPRIDNLAHVLSTEEVDDAHGAALLEDRIVNKAAAANESETGLGEDNSSDDNEYAPGG